MGGPVEKSAPQLSTVQHGCIGALVGSIEQCLMRPAVFWKAEMQQQRFSLARALNPKYCYRGLPVAVSSIAPITCIQFSATHVAVNGLKRLRGAGAADSGSDKFIAGVFAGVMSSLVQSPFQLVEVNQQNHGGTIAGTARRIWASYGFRGFYRGGSMTAVREGIFCVSYIALAPSLKQRMMERHRMTEGSALAASAFVAGGLGALLSHPADTLKTRLQGSLFAFEGAAAGANSVATQRMMRASGPREALQELRQHGPLLQQCYRGIAPRFFRIICCTYIYSTLTDTLEGLARQWTPDFEGWPAHYGAAVLGNVLAVPQLLVDRHQQ